jgi:hypothetical protein
MRRPSRTPFPPKDGDVWRVNFSRVEWQVTVDDDSLGYTKVEGPREDNWVWSPQGLINMHFPEQWGYVRFVADAVAEGAGGDDFDLPPQDEGIRLLREIHWRQWQRDRAHQRYTADLDSLGIAHRLMRNFLWPPAIQVTEYGYEAWVEEVTDLHEDGDISRWVLSEDSRVRKVKRREE